MDGFKTDTKTTCKWIFFLITIMQFKTRGIKDYDCNYYLLIQIFSSMMDDTLILFYFM